MIKYAPSARAAIRALRDHSQRKQRPEAIRALNDALVEAERMIIAAPAAGFRAPRPYPELARRGRLWVKVGRYWIAYRIGSQAVIVAVFF